MWTHATCLHAADICARQHHDVQLDVKSNAKQLEQLAGGHPKSLIVTSLVTRATRSMHPYTQAAAVSGAGPTNNKMSHNCTPAWHDSPAGSQPRGHSLVSYALCWQQNCYQPPAVTVLAGNLVHQKRQLYSRAMRPAGQQVQYTRPHTTQHGYPPAQQVTNTCLVQHTPHNTNLLHTTQHVTEHMTRFERTC
jgi:hypothetical protein